MTTIQQEAQNPETPPDRLRQIFEQSKRAWNLAPEPEALSVLKYLAANPSTSQGLLLTLAARFPHEFLSNPLLPLLHLEDPNFARTLPPETMSGLLCAEELPFWLMQGIDSVDKRHQHIFDALTSHVQRVGESRGDWRSQAEAQMRAHFQNQASEMKSDRQNPEDSAPRAALKMGLAALWLSRPLLDALAKMPSPTPRAAPQAVEEAPDLTPQQQARRAEASPAELRALAQHEARPVRVAVARHPQASRSVLDRLAEDADSWVRGAVARNENAPSAVLEKLSRDEHSVVRANAARHPQTPLRSLERLALDDDLEVLAALQHRPELPESVAQAVRERQKQSLKWGTSRPPEQQARDPQTPGATLEQLALAPGTSSSAKGRVGRNPKASRRALEALGQDEDANVRRSVARNPKAPPEILLALVDDEDSQVHQALAANRALPTAGVQALFERIGPAFEEKALLRATKDAVPGHTNSRSGYTYWFAHWQEAAEFRAHNALLRALAAHPQAPQGLRQRADGMRRQVLLLWLAGSKHAWECAVALSCPEAPPLVLLANLSHPLWEWRFAIARNPQAPRECLEALARDGHRWVRAAAQANLRGESVRG